MNAIEQQNDITAIMQLVADESSAFWNKDFEAWAQCWLHTAYIRMMGWWARGGVTVIEGWEALSDQVQTTMAAHPEPNPTAAHVRRENVNLRISENMAWLTFDQYGQDTGDLAMDMPGLSRETRILEKQHGEWKIVYVNWLLEGEATEGNGS
ncbi:MAG: nuclear transport factor 2 family protein [Anaerolinea sp.]|nr:nuclear transport factor 2 family protein [Anaerolinea sp.]